MSKKDHTLDFEKPLRDLEKQLEELTDTSRESDLDVSKEVRAIEDKIERTKRETYSELTPWQQVQLSRHPGRPFSLDYIESLFQDFQELHGDRAFRDDAALIGGPALFEGR